jgi:uncharacterized protein (DUF2164 family)
MNTLYNSSNQEFIDKSNWEALSIPEIDTLLVQYPYFSFLHLLKARKNKVEGLDQDAVAFKKTTLYFNNIPWLLYQSNQMPVFSKTVKEEVEENQAIENTYPLLEILDNSNSEEDEKLEDLNTLISHESSTIEEETTLDEFEFEDNEIELTNDSDFITEDNITNPNEVIEAIEEPDESTAPSEETEQSENEFKIELSNDLEFVSEDNITNPNEAIEDIAEPYESTTPSEEPEQSENEFKIELTNDLEFVSEDNITNPNEVIEAIEEPIESTPLSDPIEKSESELKIEIETILEPSLEIENDADLIQTEPIRETSREDFIEEAIIPIENVYGGDYFTTQGIHIDESEKQEEIKLNFTRNSFKDWLKLMNKIKTEEEIETSKEKNEYPINSLQDIEHQELDIYTETMADIYINQGLKNKAIQIFEKLSLINPSKSAYFTSRINKINTI